MLGGSKGKVAKVPLPKDAFNELARIEYSLPKGQRHIIETRDEKGPILLVPIREFQRKYNMTRNQVLGHFRRWGNVVYRDAHGKKPLCVIGEPTKKGVQLKESKFARKRPLEPVRVASMEGAHIKAKRPKAR